MSLNDQVKSFKKSLNANTMIGAKRVASGSHARSIDTGSSTSGNKHNSISNNTRAAFESQESRKKSKKAMGTAVKGGCG
ncbi:hypothetical protein BCR43DRAFT_490711 [Syncephalastrum racemosum]|uniref:Uncharacterized protein n=1 Tax=Syncephalastrum racemosum TaxID=13706 RepID=A0A1X2HGC9_SYNRA|nr:hypothetical protein BCR43DRAFT_490711 [Syncephalastrum racemosum]